MDPIVRLLRAQLPPEVLELTQQHLEWLTDGAYESLLSCDDAQRLFHDESSSSGSSTLETGDQWIDRLFGRLNQALSDRSRKDVLATHFCIGYAALLTFMQVNVTGPPLPFEPELKVFPAFTKDDSEQLLGQRQILFTSLACDGIAAYNLASNIELLCVAQAVMTSPAIIKNILPARWIKMRAVFMQQRLLAEPSSTLESLIFDDLSLVREQLAVHDKATITGIADCLLLEQAAMQLHHGHDKPARQSLESVSKDRRFEYRLTGRLGKRTKYQQFDKSQLVVLAKSADSDPGMWTASSLTDELQSNTIAVSQPKNLDLNDDTLLERISFTNSYQQDISADAKDSMPAALLALDPANQPRLDPLDSVTLLSFASSITNTSPEYGLTREETLPYAVRVLAGGSSNWQIYTQALLVRSRVEGFNSRTVERGLLQLQALVDQIIAETSNTNGQATARSTGKASTSTFLPRATESESATVAERIQYVFQLASPTRWELEAELASRWVQLGGLKTALDIYERLHMWAETALCLAATQQEERARAIVKQQLFTPSEGPGGVVVTTFDGPPRQPPPADAPRLYCILGDMDQTKTWYEKAWEVSGNRYARAQRSIGKLLFGQRDYKGAADAYKQSLQVNQLNQQSWFALGCALIELERFGEAVEAFSRCVQLDDSDAESWSNLAAALLRIDTNTTNIQVKHEDTSVDADEDARLTTEGPYQRRQKNLANALKAFQRASSIKHDSYRIWQNILVTAASVNPPDYASVLVAQRRIIELRGSAEGEQCIDVEILDRLITFIISANTSYNPAQPGLTRTTVKFVDEVVVPLITASREIWQLVSRLAIWRGRPGSALEAEEKAWRAAVAQPGWEADNKGLWWAVVEATIRLCDAYESLGPRKKTEGLASGSGQLVASDWRFKARSAIKTIMNKGRDAWEDTEGWDRLRQAQHNLAS